jgi:hypothetical protein
MKLVELFRNNHRHRERGSSSRTSSRAGMDLIKVNMESLFTELLNRLCP